MAKLPRHPWEELETRFVVKREWVNYPVMAAGLLSEWMEGGHKGPKPPDLSQIKKYAADHDWSQKRSELELAARASAVARLEKQLADVLFREAVHHLKNFTRGRKLINIGAEYVEALEAAKSKEKPGAITSTYEALAAIRVGSQLANEAAKAIGQLRKGLAPADQQDEDDEGSGLETGVVLLPAQQTGETWDKERNGKLLDGPKPGPEDEDEDDEGPKK